MGAPYYWAGKEPGFQWFSAVPFGLNPQGMMTWYLYGDGLKLWEEAYAAVQPGAAPRPVHRRADGGLVPEEDQQHRRLQGPQDAHPRARRQDRRRGRRHRRADAGRRDLHRARARRHRLDRVGRPARRHEARAAQRRPVLLLSGLARAGHHRRSSASTRRPTSRCPPTSRRIVDYACQAIQVSTFKEYEYKNTMALAEAQDRVQGQGGARDPVRRRPSRSSRSWRSRCSRRSRRRPRWPRRSTRRSTSSTAQLNDWRLISEAAYHASIAGASRGRAPYNGAEPLRLRPVCVLAAPAQRSARISQVDELRERDHEREPDDLERPRRAPPRGRCPGS